MADQFRLSSSSSNQTEHLHNRGFIRAMIGTGATAVMLAALSVGVLVGSARTPDAAIKAGPSGSTAVTATSEPETFAIVPASAIEARPVFFFGTGDNSAGFYAERPSE